MGCSPQGHRELDTTEQAHKTEAKLPEWGSAVCRAEPASRAGPRPEPECWSVSLGSMEPQNSSSVHTELLEGGSVWWLESRCWGQAVWI